ncbi:MAG: DnaJ domain-containing protein [Myxococcales bacterium]|nr:DnaJ domain-containing protein [Myxococcales bacterium]
MSDAARQPDAQGDFTRYPVPRLLYYLYKKAFVGELRLESAELGITRIYFREGLACRCDNQAPGEDVLGHVLLERGFIDHQAFHTSLEELAKGGRLQGQILLEMHAISQKQLVDALRLQLRRKLNRLFRLTEARFGLYGGEHPHGSDEEGSRVRADPLWTIYHGVRNNYDVNRLSAELARLDQHTVQLRPEFDKVRPRYGLAQEDLGLIMTLMRGALPIERVFAISNLGPVQTQMLIYTLWVTEVLVATPVQQQQVAAPTGPRQVRRAPSTAHAQAIEDASGGYAAAGSGGYAAAGSGAYAAAGSGGYPAAESPDGAIVDAPPPRSEVAEANSAPIRRRPSGVNDIAGLRRAPSGAHQAAPIRRAPSGSHETGTPSGGLKRRPSSVSELVLGAEDMPADSVQLSDAAKEMRKQILEVFNSIKDQTHFEVLDVSREANNDVIRDAYFALAKVYHPDRIAGMGLADISEQVEEIFRRINEAHTVLTDAEKRKEYEEFLEHGDSEEAGRAALEAEFAFQKGTVFFRKKQFKPALAEFKEAVKLNPKEGEHLAWVAWTIYCDPKTNRERMLPKIKQQLLEAINISPRSAASHYFLGEIYLAMEDSNRALTCFNRALDIQPNHIDAQRHVRIIRMRREKEGKGDGKGGLFGRFLKR